MGVIIISDIKRNHTEIKEELKSLGYRDTIAGVYINTQTENVLQLLSTTLQKYKYSDTKVVSNQGMKVNTNIMADEIASSVRN